MTESVIARRPAGISTVEVDADKNRLDIAVIHGFLSECSHWARGIPLATVRRTIEHSLAFGLYRDDAQIGFARVISDETTFAYLADVFVVESERGRGLGQFLVEAILAYPPLHGLRQWLLVTRDAKSLYRRCGFTELRAELAYLERVDRNSYTRGSQGAGPP
jgi:GNAT superfamily N-acetyltransferase